MVMNSIAQCALCICMYLTNNLFSLCHSPVNPFLYTRPLSRLVLSCLVSSPFCLPAPPRSSRPRCSPTSRVLFGSSECPRLLPPPFPPPCYRAPRLLAAFPTRPKPSRSSSLALGLPTSISEESPIVTRTADHLPTKSLCSRAGYCSSKRSRVQRNKFTSLLLFA